MGGLIVNGRIVVGPANKEAYDVVFVTYQAETTI